ncbi:discoidin domain-containing protein [Paenibacillus sp. SC116]|uniref:discoidin domain-containing protein n=1 Tax=Paenibacillus sp. SC116 TaxID=2968986 RepID=UPI00215A4407|nr:discoidin domain-containing protein [Paenibacillus sp. SC116]MCR8842496.1 discoidin domain-containing protein [Paenibacillus sp. SC116]
MFRININYLDYFKFRHLNCGIHQVLFDLLNKGVPVDYLFYDAYIECEDIYNQIVVKGIDRWYMHTRTLSDLSDIGMDVKITKFPNLASSYPFVQEKFSEGKRIFLWIWTEYLPHLANEPRSMHAISLESYDQEKGTFIISDIPNLMGHTYDESRIQEAFDCLDDRCRNMAYICDEQYNFTEETVSLLINKFEDGFLAVSNNLNLYDTIIEKLQEHSLHMEEYKKDIKNYENVLAMVAGSRYFLSKFFRITRYPGTDKLEEIVDLSTTIRNVFLKILLGGKSNLNKTIEKIKALKELETENIKMIKKRIIQNRSHSVSKMSLQPETIVDLKLKYEILPGNGLLLKWEDILDEYIYQYQIYANNTLLGVTVRNFYEIQNVDHTGEYNIKVKVKTVRGDISLSNDEVTLITASRGKDYALGKPVFCSSEESDVNRKENVNDGSSKTRWSSAAGSDHEWICIDLLEEVEIRSVVINWEEAYAISYTIDISNDNETWETIVNTDSGKGGIEEYSDFGSAMCRYVKLTGVKKATLWGYSLWKLEVYTD